MNKKKIIIITILVVLLLFIGYTLRKYIIIKDLQKNIETHISSTNYQLKIIRNDSGVITTYNYNKKDNKIAYFIEKNDNGNINKLSIYDSGKGVNCYSEIGDVKTLEHANKLVNGGIFNYLKDDTYGTLQYLIIAMKANIKSVEINGKSCYLIKNYADMKDRELYIEKDTGLCIQYIENEAKIEYNYELGNVKDDIFVEPDASQYNKK